MGDMPAENTLKPLHVLVAGAGIGGLTAAIALRQQGHQVEIFEQSKLSKKQGPPSTLPPTAMAYSAEWASSQKTSVESNAQM